MTVGKLIDILNGYDEDMEIAIKVSNSIYAESICGASIRELRAFYGDNTDVVILKGSEQIGAV